MPKKLQINAAPSGRVKLGLLSAGTGCCFTQHLTRGWGILWDCLAPATGSVWGPCEQRCGMRGLHEFFLKNALTLPGTPHQVMVTAAHPHPALP